MTTAEILNENGEAMVLKLRELISPKSATGKTVQSVTYKVFVDEDKSRLLLWSRPYLETLETGRGPRHSSQYEGFDQNILEWMKARGIDKGSEKKNQQFARFLTLRINRDGDRTYQMGGRELFSKQLDEMVNAMQKELIDNFENLYIKEVTDIFK